MALRKQLASVVLVLVLTLCFAPTILVQGKLYLFDSFEVEGDQVKDLVLNERWVQSSFKEAEGMQGQFRLNAGMYLCMNICFSVCMLMFICQHKKRGK
jgi:hypothetical protein